MGCQPCSFANSGRRRRGGDLGFDVGVSEIGVDDDFFDLGGTSLALVNIVMKMSKRFAIPLDTSIVLGGATVSALARAVKGRMAGANRHGPPVEQAVAETCASALGLSEVGIDDDFFDLGGTSLALITSNGTEQAL